MEMKDENVISLGEIRAHQKDDAREWTALEALRSLIRRIEAGEINPVGITTWYWDAAGGPQPPKVLRYTAAGLTHEQHVALLAMAQRDALARWRPE